MGLGIRGWRLVGLGTCKVEGVGSGSQAFTFTFMFLTDALLPGRRQVDMDCLY